MNQALVEVCAAEKADVLISIQMNYEIWTETLDFLNQGGVSTLLFCTDDSFKFNLVSRHLAPHFQKVATTYDYRLRDYRALPYSGALHTQWATSSNLIREPLGFHNCTYDVTFVGAAHGDRAEKVDRLQALGVPITCFGQGWPNGPLPNLDAVMDVFNQSRITLNFANSTGVNQIKARPFEACGAGTCVLTDPSPGLESYLIPQKEILIAESLDNMAQIIQEVLDQPDFRDQLAQNGSHKVKSQHLYTHRFEQILNQISLHTNQIEPASFQKIAEIPDPNILLRCFSKMLEWALKPVFKQKTRRFLRRGLFEVMARISPRHTYSRLGLPGRLYCHDG